MLRYMSTAAADRGNGRHPPGRPYLQSHRAAAAFQTPAHQLGKTLMKKVQMVLVELQVPEQVMATQIICDLQDALKKDVVTLLTLQKVVAKKESDLQLLKQQQQGGGGGGAAMDVRSTSPGLGLQLTPAGGAGGSSLGAGVRPGLPEQASKQPTKRKSTGGGGGGPPGKGKRIKK